MSKINWKRRNWKFKLGLVLLLISMVSFAFVIIIPGMELSRSAKITFTSISFVVAEVSFYTGGFLLGKELFKKYKALLNPLNWFKKKDRLNTPVIEDNINPVDKLS
jgi:hypothetical protein